MLYLSGMINDGKKAKHWKIVFVDRLDTLEPVLSNPPDLLIRLGSWVKYNELFQTSCKKSKSIIPRPYAKNGSAMCYVVNSHSQVLLREKDLLGSILIF